VTNNPESKKKIVFLFVLVVCFSLFIFGYLIKDCQDEKKIIAKGDRAPEFRLPALDGRFVDLAGYRGRVVMVHFWATWCPPCVEEMPTLEKLYQKLKGTDFELLTISVDEGSKDVVLSFMKKHGLTIPVLLDSGKAVSGLYGTFRFPETYIADRGGVVRYKAIGPRDWGRPENERIVKDILDGR
jgi:peroxiredoxin